MFSPYAHPHHAIPCSSEDCMSLSSVAKKNPRRGRDVLPFQQQMSAYRYGKSKKLFSQVDELHVYPQCNAYVNDVAGRHSLIVGK